MLELAPLPPTIQARLDNSKWRSFLLRMEIFLLNLPRMGVNSGFIFMEITGTAGMMGEERERERDREKKEKLMSSSACVLLAPQRHVSFINVVFGENLIGFMLLRP